MPDPLGLFDALSSDGTADSAALGRSILPCLYCGGSIPATTFVFWSSAKRLLSAECPSCDRRVTLATSTWRRWLKRSVT